MTIGSRFEQGVGDMCRASKLQSVADRYLNESIKSGLGLQTCQIHFEQHQAKQSATHPSHIGASYASYK